MGIFNFAKVKQNIIFKINIQTKIGVFFVFVALFVLFGLARHAEATTYYLDATLGNDLNSGTSTLTAWKTVAKANTAMSTAVIKAGDSVLFKRGETFSGYINVTVSGTPSNYLTFGAYDSGVKPIIDASGLSYGINARNELEYVAFEDLDIRNSSNSEVFLFNTITNFIFTNVETRGGGSAYKIQTGNFSNITIRGASSTGYATAGINLAGTAYNNIFLENSNFTATGTNGYLTGAGNYSNIKILTSTFKNHASHGIYFSAGNINGLEIRGGETSYNAGAGLYMYQSNSNILISNYAARYNVSNGLYIYSNSNKVISDITIENSILTNNSSGVGFNWVGNNARINNVTSSDNNVDGFNVHGTWTDIIFDRCVAENNGVVGYSGAGDGYSFHDSSSGTIRYSIAKNNYKTAIAHVNSSSVYMEYNIFTHTTNGTLPLVYVDGDGYHYLYNNILYSGANTGTAMHINGSTVDIKNNIIYGFDNGILKTAGTTTEDYNLVYNTVSSSWSGMSTGTHSFSANPLFVNPSGYDFSLQVGSPAIDAGVNRGSLHNMAILPGSVWPFSVATSSQDVRGAGWEMGAYLSPVPFSPIIGTPEVLSNSSIRWNFTDTANDESGFRLYDGSNLLKTTVATPNVTYIDETSLTPGTLYSGRYVKAYNSYGESAASLAAVSTSTIPLPPAAAPVSGGGGGIPVGYSNLPAVPMGGFGVQINDNAISTQSTKVVLTLKGGSDTTRMAVSNYPDFRNSIQEIYASKKNWDICSEILCQPGRYNVYVKYYTSWGTVSDAVTDEIAFQNTANNTLSSGSATIKELSTNNSVGNSITENIVTFKRDLRPGLAGQDVKKLQLFLKLQGKSVYPEGKISGKYDYATIKAVKRFQAKNKIKSNGLFGPQTRSKVNKLVSVLSIAI